MDIRQWWSDVGGSFFGQPWVRWVAFVVLVLSVAYLWQWAVVRTFGK